MPEIAPDGTIVWDPGHLVWECARRAVFAEADGNLNERDFFLGCAAAIKEAYINNPPPEVAR